LFCCSWLSGLALSAQAQTRVDSFGKTSNRTDSVMIDERAGRVDRYEEQPDGLLHHLALGEGWVFRHARQSDRIRHHHGRTYPPALAP
jgi:hypothetical protein